MWNLFCVESSLTLKGHSLGKLKFMKLSEAFCKQLGPSLFLSHVLPLVFLPTHNSQTWSILPSMVEAEVLNLPWIFKEKRKIKPTSTSRSIAQLLNLPLRKGEETVLRHKMVHGATVTHLSFQVTSWALVSVLVAVGTRGEEEQSIKLLKWCDKPVWQQLVIIWQN